ncbi:glycosyltransferase family 2 protein [Caballeronia grimmiae]|uniref:glycosyltransferase family 2 protein n=1 Tax=Caballeronia grimmiae TaxID=1071679 RepID=UPI0038B799E0
MKEAPFFSVIVPTHNRAMLLRRALQSIRSQAPPVEFEVIVVSDMIDADTDVTCAQCLSADDIYVRRNGASGPSESRNVALSMAKGQYVLFLDDDDAWHPGFLGQLYAQLTLSPSVPVFFNCSVVQERRFHDGSEILSEDLFDLAGCLTEDVYIKNQVHMSCFAIPRTMLNGVKFDSFMRAYEDWDFLLSVFDRKMPVHFPLLGSRIFEVPPDVGSSDRRGSSRHAHDFNSVLDYLYVYRRHPASNDVLKQKRSALLLSCGISVAPEMM